jgi:Chlorite dismutase
VRADDLRSDAPIRHAAYICLRVPVEEREALAEAAVDALAARLGFRNEYDPPDDRAGKAIAFLGRADAAPAQIADDELLHADAVVYVGAPTSEDIEAFRGELKALVGSVAATRVLLGVQRPRNYTGNAMHNFSYAYQVLQQPGEVMPNAFLVPMNKTAEWWQKSWMERHTYFLPRYDDGGRMLNEGHTLAAADGIPCLLRRTYKSSKEPAPPGAYDFISYFECSDDDVATFHEVCAALRDITKNPEWKFVREGPTWHGRRAVTWAELFT